VRPLSEPKPVGFPDLVAYGWEPYRKSLQANIPIISAEITAIFSWLGRHALCLSDIDVSFTNGTQIALICQVPFVEYWAWEKDFLKQLGHHYTTGEQLPLENISSHVSMDTLFNYLRYIVLS